MQQHCRDLTEKGTVDDNGNTINPRKVFYEDIFKETEEWKEEGNHITVGPDANKDLRISTTHRLFRDLGMEEAILAKRKKAPQSPTK